MLMSTAKGEQTFKVINQAICALNGSAILMIQAENSHNLCKTHAQMHFPKLSHLKSPHFFGDSICLAAPTFLCTEALALSLFQTRLRQPGLPQDHKRR